MSHTIMFYNLENLYDSTANSDGKDTEFTPAGSKRWTSDRYYSRLNNLSEVFAAVASAHGGFPAVAGVSEVENLSVLKTLASRKNMAAAGYSCLLYESNDSRGVDVGALYRPDVFKLIGSESVKLVLRSGREYVGRNILAMWGTLEGEMFAFYICHFLSRRAGVDSSAGFRRAGAETVRDHAVSLARKYPGIKVVVMGDMNDNPSDDSLAMLLKARRSPEITGKGEYFNPFWQLYDEGKGSSRFYNRWVMYDNIIVSRNLIREEVKKPAIWTIFGALHPKRETDRRLAIVKIDSRHYGQVFRRSFMLHKGWPKRAFNKDKYVSGYSDHLPVVIKLG